MGLHENPQAQAATLPPHLVELVTALAPELRALVRALPQRLMDVAAAAPVYVDRRVAADLLTQHIIPVSPRSLEVWPLPWRHANGKALSLLIVILAVGYAKLSSAPVITGGRRPRDAQQPAAWRTSRRCSHSTSEADHAGAQEQ